jgi:hypothetical protein
MTANKQEKIDNRITDFLDRFQKVYKPGESEISSKRMATMNQSPSSTANKGSSIDLNANIKEHSNQSGKGMHSFLSSIQSQSNRT